MKLFLLGSLAFDELGHFKGRFKELLKAGDEKLSLSFIVEDLAESFGGCSGNMAYGLGLLGVPATVCGRLGPDGRAYEELLQNWGMDTRFIGHSSLKTAKAVITSDLDGAQIAHFNPGALQGTEPFELPETAKEGDILLIGPERKERMLEAAEAGRSKGLRVFLDPGQLLHVFTKDELMTWIQGGEILFLNEFEWGLFQEKTGLNEQQLLEYVQALIVTLGAEGAKLIQKTGAVQVSAFPAVFKDGTGAGDAFRGGFLGASAQELSYKTAMECGVVMGSAAVEIPFAQGYILNEERRARLKELGLFPERL